jgi:hypothetical protein
MRTVLAGARERASSSPIPSLPPAWIGVEAVTGLLRVRGLAEGGIAPDR